MAKYEVRENSGLLFKNDRKTTSNHPDRTGSANIGGVDYYVSGWVKKDRNGDPFMSLAFRRKDSPKPEANGNKRELDDEIPF